MSKKTKYEGRPMVTAFKKWFDKRLKKGKISMTYTLPNGTVHKSAHADILIDAFYLGVDEERARMNPGYGVGIGPQSVGMTIADLESAHARYPHWMLRDAYQYGSDSYYKHKNRPVKGA